MSIRIMSLVWDGSKHSGSALLALQAIADCARDDGRAWPGYGEIARKARVTRRHAIDLIKQLEKSGELTVTRNGGPRGANLYVVNAELLASHAAEWFASQQDNPDSNTGTTGEKISPPDSEKISPEGGEKISLPKSSAGEAGFTRGVKRGSPALVKPTSPEPSFNHQGTINPPNPPAGGPPGRGGGKETHRGAGDRVLDELLSVVRGLSPSDPARWVALTNAASEDVRGMAERMGGWANLCTWSRADIRSAFTRAWRQRGNAA